MRGINNTYFCKHFWVFFMDNFENVCDTISLQINRFIFDQNSYQTMAKNIN